MGCSNGNDIPVVLTSGGVFAPGVVRTRRNPATMSAPRVIRPPTLIAGADEVIECGCSSLRREPRLPRFLPYDGPGVAPAHVPYCGAGPAFNEQESASNKAGGLPASGRAAMSAPASATH
jgi:hypothetical protein